MAELIPVQYRLRTAQKQHLEKWMLIAIVAVGVALAGVTYTYMLARHEKSAMLARQTEYRQKASAIDQSRQVLARRQELANRMQKVEQLMDDKTLLSLLKNISEGFASSDCLEYINIEAKAKDGEKTNDNGKDKNKDKDVALANGNYVVHITGITSNSATLADLVNRLSHQTTPAMNVVLESSHRETLMDGQVMRFEILCEKQAQKGI
jgi:hypothetical protein